MGSRFSISTCFLVVSGAAALAAGQPPAHHEDVSHALRAGDRVVIADADGDRRGRFVMTRDEGVVIGTDSGELSVPWTAIDRIDRYRNGMLLGPVIGAAAGAAAGWPLRLRLLNEGANGDAALGWTIAIGAGVGLLIDATTGSTRTVYRRPGTGPAVTIRPGGSGLVVSW